MKYLYRAVVVVALGCGRGAPSAPPNALPASAAGTSATERPGLPAGFSGTVRSSIELRNEQRKAIEEANRQSDARAEHAQIRTSLRGATR